MTKYLITGKNSQLAKEFIKIFNNDKTNSFQAVSHQLLSIESYKDVDECVRSYCPDVILNLASSNNVDQIETDDTDAFLTNAVGCANLANICKKYGIFLAHFSTDYVFGGELYDGNELWEEFEDVEPVNKYGQTKLLGEQFIQQIGCYYHIYRVSWLYGGGKQNFIYKLQQWIKNKQDTNLSDVIKISVADDEISIPTSAKMVAETVVQCLNNRTTGEKELFHLVNSGFCSRFEWASEIVRILGLNVELIPVSKDIFLLNANRPLMSALSNDYISAYLNIKIPTWQESLKEYLNSAEFRDNWVREIGVL